MENKTTVQNEKEWHVTKEQILTIIECASAALSDGDMFDAIADKLDIEDSELKEIQEKLNDDPAMAHVVKSVDEYDKLVEKVKLLTDAVKNDHFVEMAQIILNLKYVNNDLVAALQDCKEWFGDGYIDLNTPKRNLYDKIESALQKALNQ